MGADLKIMKKDIPADVWLQQDEQAVESGYFRDPYNGWSVLWQYGLSWWDDVSHKLTDEEGTISVENAKKFLRMLEDRQAVFEDNMSKETEEMQKEFRTASKLLKKFLWNAIELDSDIATWL